MTMFRGALDLPTAAAARASRDLAWALLLTNGEVNAAISPSSLTLALGLLTQGADDAAFTALDSDLGLTGTGKGQALASLRRRLTHYDSLPTSISLDTPPTDPIVHQASQVIAVGDARIQPEFTWLAEEMFGATTQRVATPLDLQPALDAWIAEHTAGLIEGSAIAASPALRLVIQDAVLFVAAWARPFRTSSERLGFHSPTGIQEFNALGGTFDLAHTTSDRWEAVRLPYDGRLAMDVILPAEGVGPADLGVEDLEAAEHALNKAEPAKVAVTMPAVDLRSRHDLLEPITEFGASFRGNLEGIFPGADVSAMVQQTRLEVNAKGTMGAAVTEIAMVTGAPIRPERIIEFTVDRPYVMTVTDTHSGWPLFLARVLDAAAAQSS